MKHSASSEGRWRPARQARSGRVVQAELSGRNLSGAPSANTAETNACLVTSGIMRDSTEITPHVPERDIDKSSPVRLIGAN